VAPTYVTPGYSQQSYVTPSYTEQGYAPADQGYSEQGYAPADQGYAPATPAFPAVPAEENAEGQDYAPEQAPAQADNSAQVRVIVPPDAKVWFAGQETTQTGTEREFSSPALTPGKSYYYEVRARWMQNGKPVDQTRRVKVLPNQTTTVAFVNAGS